MSKVILLTTGWSENEWQAKTTIDFSYDASDLTDIEILTKSCPLMGIGIYGKAIGKDFSYKPIEYIEISQITIDEQNGRLRFYFKRINTSKILSSQFKELLSSKKFVTALSSNKLLQIFAKLGETPPNNWLNVVNNTPHPNGHNHPIENKLPNRLIHVNTPFIEHDGVKFRSHTETRIYEALKKKAVLFFVNPLAILGGQNLKREPDFLICQEGKWGVLEVNGDAFHQNAAKDHDRARLFKTYGLLFIEAFTAEECTNKPDEVVEKFLSLLEKSGINQHFINKQLQHEFELTKTELENHLNQVNQNVQSLQSGIKTAQATRLSQVNELNIELNEANQHIKLLQNELAHLTGQLKTENRKFITKLKRKERDIQTLEEQLQPDWVIYILVGLTVLAAFLIGAMIPIAIN